MIKLGEEEGETSIHALLYVRRSGHFKLLLQNVFTIYLFDSGNSTALTAGKL